MYTYLIVNIFNETINKKLQPYTSYFSIPVVELLYHILTNVIRIKNPFLIVILITLKLFHSDVLIRRDVCILDLKSTAMVWNLL